MKHFGFIVAAMVLLSTSACNGSGATTNGGSAQESMDTATERKAADAFEAFAEHFSQSASFAYAEVGGRKVLLVSQETFGNNENADREGIEASIFALDGEGRIVALGSIRSQGTLYPVSMLDGRIMVAGHRFVRIYSIRGEEVPELVLDNCQEGEGEELTEMFKTFEKGTSVKFSKSLRK